LDIYSSEFQVEELNETPQGQIICY
jgi:hypothetical protein